MAGYVVVHEGCVEPTPFNVGDPDLVKKIHEVNNNRRYLCLQLDGDEMEAVLWGLEQWNTPGPRIPQAREGVWVAYHSDWSGARVFLHEIEALRYAVDNSASVSFWKFDEDKPR